MFCRKSIHWVNQQSPLIQVMFLITIVDLIYDSHPRWFPKCIAACEIAPVDFGNLHDFVFFSLKLVYLFTSVKAQKFIGNHEMNIVNKIKVWPSVKYTM